MSPIIPYNPFYKFASVFLESTYRLFSPIKPCSLLLEKDSFDGIAFTPDSFYAYSKQFFNKPASYYKHSNPPQYASVIEVPSVNNNYRQYKFPSPFVSAWETNNTACFNHFSGTERSDTILLFAPGWARANLDAESAFCNNLLKHGIDSCLLIKPFHQQRTPKGFYSGEMFISGNIFLTAMNFRQFVAEIIYLIGYFKTMYKKVGLIGMSSGGFQCGLAADAEAVDFYFPVITGATLGSITWEGKLTKHVKKDIIKKGISEHELNKAWAISDQVNLAHNCKATHIKQFISLYDDVIPSKYQFMLWEIYHKPELSLLHCAHAGIYFYLKKIASEISLFINSRR
jgi:hypothetical protein